MYVLNISVNELSADLYYDEYSVALKEFKECVIEMLVKPDFDNDDMIMKITDNHALFVVQSGNASYKIELSCKGE